MSQLGRVIKKLVFAALTGHYIFKLEKTPGLYFFFFLLISFFYIIFILELYLNVFSTEIIGGKRTRNFESITLFVNKTCIKIVNKKEFVSPEQVILLN